MWKQIPSSCFHHKTWDEELRKLWIEWSFLFPRHGSICGCRGRAPLFLYLHVRWHCVSDSHFDHINRKWRIHMYFLTGRLSELQSLSGGFWGDKDLLPLPRTEQHICGCPAHSIVTIDTRIIPITSVYQVINIYHFIFRVSLSLWICYLSYWDFINKKVPACCELRNAWIYLTYPALNLPAYRLLLSTLSLGLLSSYLLTYLLTYSMEQSPSWEANWFCS